MNEQQRADFVARAVDDLVSGLELTFIPAELDASDVDALMRVARTRLETSRATARDGLQYEGAVWQRVLQRLDNASAAFARDTSQQAAPASYDLGDETELREMAALRRQMSARLHAFAEAHREEVWQRIQERLGRASAAPEPATPAWKTPFLRIASVFNRSQPGQAYADLVAPAIDSVAHARPAEVGDADLDDLVRVAWARKAASQVAVTNAEAGRERVWARVQQGLRSKQVGGSPSAPAPAPRRPWARTAAVAAAVAAAVIAIGPLPATGFADHPAARAVRFVGGQIGVIETGPPPAPGNADTIDGESATAASAASALGLPVAEPGTPRGFELASTELFPAGITSDGGVFVVSFRGPGGRTLTVYQEAAGPAAISAAAGSATAITLSDGTQATYFDGRWDAADGSFSWVLGGTQTLVFEREGLRTIIVHSGPADAQFLAEYATALVAR